MPIYPLIRSWDCGWEEQVLVERPTGNAARLRPQFVAKRVVAPVIYGGAIPGQFEARFLRQLRLLGDVR